MTPLGSGFWVNSIEAKQLGLDRRDGLGQHIRRYRNGRDLMSTPREVMAIDLFDLDAEKVRDLFPEVYQHILQTVKPERDRQNRESYKRLWWIFGEPRKELRPALQNLTRYIATAETAKHRVFQFLESEIMPDQSIITICLSDSFYLGVLSSRIHVGWTLSQGSTLEDRPRYTKSQCFDPFPFPDPDEFTRARIASIAEKLDQHRKEVQAKHPGITLTQMYNVLEKLKSGAALSREDERVRDDGLVLILRELHEELDQAVAQAYGWPVDLPEQEVLARLVALNTARAAEEARGHVRWLRPEYQIPRFGSAAQKQEQLEADLGLAPAAAAKPRASFPSGAVEQTGAVMAALAASAQPLSALDVALTFRQGRKAEPQIRATLAAMARLGFLAIHDSGQRFSTLRAA